LECADLTSTPAGLPGRGPRLSALAGRDPVAIPSVKYKTGRDSLAGVATGF